MKVKVKQTVAPSLANEIFRDKFDFPGESSGADMLFNIAEMALMKTDPDGTRYYMPRYASAVSKPKVSKGRTAAWK